MSNLSLLILGLAAGLPLIAAAAGEKTRLSGRIFKGEYDTENEHRYHVAIVRVHDNDTIEHVCGGAIIESRYVLSAANCLSGHTQHKLLVRSGWDMSPEKPQEERRTYHKVARIMFNKDYNYTECRSHQHDIAILKVQRSFDLTDDSRYRKVHLPEPDNDYEGYTATMTGYGVEGIGIIHDETVNRTDIELLYPRLLRYYDTEVIPMEECKRLSPVIVTNGNICTKASGSGSSCIGDSGGPLVHDGVVIGIRNVHSEKCLPKYPELFTRVSAYLDFINNVLNQEAAANVDIIKPVLSN